MGAIRYLTLCTLLGVLSGCGSAAIEKPGTGIIAAEKQKEQEITDDLRNFIYSLYDLNFVKEQSSYELFFDSKFRDRKKETEGRIESNAQTLEKKLSEYGFNQNYIDELKKGNVPSELKRYYLTRGMLFRNFGNLEKSEIYNFELKEIISQKKEQIDFNGKQMKLNIIYFGDIQVYSFYDYRFLKMKGRPCALTSLYHNDVIEINLSAARENAKDMFLKLSKMRNELENNLENPNELNKYILDGKVTNSLLNTIRRMFAYQSVKENYEKALKSENPEKYFIEARTEQLVEYSKMKHIINMLDDFKTPQGLPRNFQKKKHYHADVRSYLIRINKGFGHEVLSECCAILANPTTAIHNKETYLAARDIIDLFCGFVVEESKREEFEYVDYSEYNKPEDLVHIFKQLPNLNQKHLREIGEHLFKKVYNGKSLREFLMQEEKKHEEKRFFDSV